MKGPLGMLTLAGGMVRHLWVRISKGYHAERFGRRPAAWALEDILFGRGWCGLNAVTLHAKSKEPTITLN
jgi:hypothetical protein